MTPSPERRMQQRRLRALREFRLHGVASTNNAIGTTGITTEDLAAITEIEQWAIDDLTSDSREINLIGRHDLDIDSLARVLFIDPNWLRKGRLSETIRNDNEQPHYGFVHPLLRADIEICEIDDDKLSSWIHYIEHQWQHRLHNLNDRRLEAACGDVSKKLGGIVLPSGSMKVNSPLWQWMEPEAYKLFGQMVVTARSPVQIINQPTEIVAAAIQAIRDRLASMEIIARSVNSIIAAISPELNPIMDVINYANLQFPVRDFHDAVRSYRTALRQCEIIHDDDNEKIKTTAWDQVAGRILNRDQWWSIVNSGLDEETRRRQENGLEEFGILRTLPHLPDSRNVHFHLLDMYEIHWIRREKTKF